MCIRDRLWILRMPREEATKYSSEAEYGCEMTFHKVCDDDPAGIKMCIRDRRRSQPVSLARQGRRKP